MKKHSSSRQNKEKYGLGDSKDYREKDTSPVSTKKKRRITDNPYLAEGNRDKEEIGIFGKKVENPYLKDNEDFDRLESIIADDKDDLRFNKEEKEEELHLFRFDIGNYGGMNEHTSHEEE